MKSGIAFGIGLSVGGCLGYIYAKKQHGYREPEQEDEGVTPEEPETNEPELVMEATMLKPDPAVYLKKYNTVSDDESKPLRLEKPYVISSDDFEDPEYDGYTKITLTWHSNEILIDEDDTVIPEAAYFSNVGNDFQEYFENGEACVYVRNDRRKTDYEILAVASPYDVVPERETYPDDDDDE